MKPVQDMKRKRTVSEHGKRQMRTDLIYNRTGGVLALKRVLSIHSEFPIDLYQILLYLFH